VDSGYSSARKAIPGTILNGAREVTGGYLTDPAKGDTCHKQKQENPFVLVHKDCFMV
jgi:hypothetical protein